MCVGCLFFFTAVRTVVINVFFKDSLDLHLRRYTQLTQRQQFRGDWSARDKSDQLHRLKIFYADPQTPRGDLDPHRYLSNRVAT